VKGSYKAGGWGLLFNPKTTILFSCLFCQLARIWPEFGPNLARKWPGLSILVARTVQNLARTGPDCPFFVGPPNLAQNRVGDIYPE